MIATSNLPSWFIDGATLGLGLVMGSFANVVAYRVPRRISLGVSRSRCPTCLHTLAWWENIPLLSYLLLAGKCRNCKRQISIRYPIVEIITATGWFVVVRSIGLHPELPAFLWFVTTLVILSVIDLEHRRIPWRVVFPSFIAGVLLLFLAALRAEDLGTWGRALAGAG
ncbi:MAG TPA: prepilin peptidase, partial [Actinomycetota bacterium]|nr:prepilin peptidase [Actinomycetota bacterium]